MVRIDDRTSQDGDVNACVIERGLRELGLADRPLEVHVSLRSLGDMRVEPDAIVDGALEVGCTVLAATMAPDSFGIPASRRSCRGSSSVHPLGARPRSTGNSRSCR